MTNENSTSLSGEKRAGAKIFSRPIGDVFEFRNKELVVTECDEYTDCEGCAVQELATFSECLDYRSDAGVICGQCSPPFRSDGKNVIFTLNKI